MATVTGYTAAKMNEIANSTVVGGFVDIHGRLLLTTRGGDELDAGSVVGPKGDTGIGPTGSIAIFAGDVAPPGYLLCLGQAVSRTAYSSLFAVIGTKYGAGDGATTFNLPNLKGRVPVGQDSAQTEFGQMGKTGGAKKVALTVAQLAAHTHIQNAHTHANTLTSATVASSSHSHTHVSPVAVSSGTVGVVHPADAVLDSAGTYVLNTVLQANTGVHWVGAPGVALMERYYVTSSGPSATTTVGISNASATAVNQSTGSGEAHENLQPYIVMNYIIKT